MKKILIENFRPFAFLTLILLLMAFYPKLLKTEGVIPLAGKAEGTEIKQQPLRLFTESDLSEFNGTDPDKPVYIGYNGYVYDVTMGSKEYYDMGMPYHYLAGRDSSKELNMIGGNIIKTKYPVIGKLLSSK